MIINFGLCSHTLITMGLGNGILNRGIRVVPTPPVEVSFKDKPSGIAIEDKRVKYKEKVTDVRFKQNNPEVDFK